MSGITAPNAGAFGIWGPQYAAALAAQSGSPVAGPLNMLAMGSRAQQEQGGYAEALGSTQQRQLELARMEADAKMQEALIQQMAPLAAQGATGYADPVMQQFGITPNAQAGGTIDDAHLEAAMAQAFQRRAGGVVDLRESGIGPSMENTPQALMPSDPMAPLLPMEEVMTPGNQNDATRAQAATMQAQAAQTNAARPRGGGGGGRPQTTEVRMVTNPITGAVEPTVVIRNASPELAQQYMPGVPANSVEASGGALSAQQRLERLRRRE